MAVFFTKGYTTTGCKSTKSTVKPDWGSMGSYPGFVCFFTTSLNSNGRLVSIGSGPGTPSVSCMFLYYKSHWQWAIGVQVKARPLCKRSREAVCFTATSLNRSGRFVSKSMQGHFASDNEKMWCVSVLLYYKFD